VACNDFSECLERSATLVAGDPWLERTPWFVRECTPLQVDGGWCLRDSRKAITPLSRNFANVWPLFAVSGGMPVTIFGEWDGNVLLPLSVISSGRFVPLP
jgi:hypothetical protein